jgi:hypothetical protein
MPRPISEQIQGTYFRLRFTVAIIGILFPAVLYVGGKISHFGLRSSMSAYYWATLDAPCPCGDKPTSGKPCPTIGKNSPQEKACFALPPAKEAGSLRSFFIGFLFAVGAMLFVNKGYTRWEDILLNIAGVSAWLIALFPMPWSGPLGKLYWVHGTAAIVFFLAIASVCAFCSHATVDLIDDPVQQKWYKSVYWFLASLMVGFPLSAYILNVWIRPRNNAVYWIECSGILAFAAYWIVKGIEMSGLDTEAKVVSGSTYIPPKLNVRTSLRRMFGRRSGVESNKTSLDKTP